MIDTTSSPAPAPAVCQGAEVMSMYSGHDPRPRRSCTLPELMDAIRSGGSPVPAARARMPDGTPLVIPAGTLADRVAAIRACQDPALGKMLKGSLPGVTPAGIFHPKRGLEHWQSVSGLIMLDIDHLDDGALESLARHVPDAAWVTAAWRTASGRGLRILVKVDPATLLHGDRPDPNRYTAAWTTLAQWAHDTWGIDADEAAKDASRLSYLSHDPEAFYRTDAACFDWTAYSPKPATGPTPASVADDEQDDAGARFLAAIRPSVRPRRLPPVESREQRALTYVRHMPPSIQGQHGSAALMAVLRVIIDGFALRDHPDAYWRVIEAWNQACAKPPWSRKELEHGVRNILKTPAQDFGWLVSDERARTPCQGFVSLEAAAAQGDEQAKAALDAVQPFRKDERDGLRQGVSTAAVASLLRALRFCHVRYNRAAGRYELVTEQGWRELDDAALRALKERFELLFASSVAKDTFETAVLLIADANPADPLRDWLSRLEWDGIERIQRFAEALHATLPCQVAALRAWLLGAAQRGLLEDGQECELQYALFLIGHEGCHKSTFVRAISGGIEPATLRQWGDQRPELADALRAAADRIEAWIRQAGGVRRYADLKLDPSSKDAYVTISGVWIGEISESVGFTRHDADAWKQFMSCSADRYRPPYGRTAVTVPRRCAFVFTSNHDEALRGERGERRYVPIVIPDGATIDTAWIAAHADQLWAEAVARVRRGERPVLDRDTLRALAALRQDVRQRSVWDEALDAYTDQHPEAIDAWRAQGTALGDLVQALAACLPGALGMPDRRPLTTPELAALKATLRARGWHEDRQRRQDGTRPRLWYPPTNGC